MPGSSSGKVPGGPSGACWTDLELGAGPPMEEGRRRAWEVLRGRGGGAKGGRWEQGTRSVRRGGGRSETGDAAPMDQGIGA